MWRVCILSALMIAGCATVQPGDPSVPIPNFRQVEKDLYRGGQLDTDGITYLKSIGVKTIVDINDIQSLADGESTTAKAAGLEWHYLPMSGWEPPRGWRVDEIQALMKDPTKRPLYLHCQHGQDRTGLMFGIWRVEQKGWSPKDAHDEMLKFGFHEVLVPLEVYFWARTKRQ